MDNENVTTNVPETEPTAAVPQNQPSAAVPETESTGNAAAPKKGMKFSPVKIGVVAAVVLVVILVAANAKALANTMKKTFSSPAKYYQSVEQSNMATGIEASLAVYDQVKENTDIPSLSQSFDFSVTLGEKIKKYVKKQTEVDITDLGTVGVSLDLLMKKDMLGAGAGIKIGKKSVISANALLDIEKKMAYLQVPELTKKYLGFEIEEDMLPVNDFDESYAQMKKVYDALPKQKELDKIFDRYAKVALSKVTDVKKGKETLEVGEIKQKYTTLTVELDQDVLAEIFEALAEEAEKDKDLNKLIVSTIQGIDEEADAEDIAEEMIEEVVDGLNEMAKDIAKEKISIEMVVYVDGEGTVYGRVIEAKATSTYTDWNGDEHKSTQAVEIDLLYPVDGSKMAVEFAIKTKEDDGTKNVVAKVEGSGKLSGDKLTGEFDIKAMGLSILNVQVSKFDLGALKEGYLNGTFTFKLSETAASAAAKYLPYELREVLEDMNIALNKATITLETENSKKSAKIALGVDYKEELLFRLEMAAETKADASTKAPSDKDVILIEKSSDMEDWVDTIDWDDFLKALKKVVPEDLYDLVEEEIDEIR